MPAQTTNLKHLLLAAGPQSKLVWIKFTPNGASAPTVDEAHGCSATVTRSGAGVYVVSLTSNALKAMGVVGLTAIPGDTNYHELVHAESVTNKTVTVTHRTVTYANIVSAGPAASDTCGQITLVVLCREAS
jgi:hypothetical protein